MIKKSILALTVVGFLIGCNGGDSSASSPSKDDKENSNSLWKPVASNFTCVPKTIKLNGTTSDSRFATEGDIKVECQTVGIYESAKYSLAGVDFIEIVDYTKHESLTGTSDKYGSFSSVETYNFKTGEHSIKRVSKILTLECVERYQTILPKRVYADNIDALFDFNFDMVVRVDTTCPASYYDERDETNDNIDTSKGSFVRTIDNVITDSRGKTYKTSSEWKVSR